MLGYEYNHLQEILKKYDRQQVKTNYILNKYNYRAKKKFGQNFIVEPNIINKVVDQIDKDSTIIEIGAGLGAITQAVAEKVKR